MPRVPHKRNSIEASLLRSRGNGHVRRHIHSHAPTRSETAVQFAHTSSSVASKSPDDHTALHRLLRAPPPLIYCDFQRRHLTRTSRYTRSSLSYLHTLQPWICPFVCKPASMRLWYSCPMVAQYHAVLLALDAKYYSTPSIVICTAPMPHRSTVNTQ